MWITSVRYRPMVADSTLRRGALDRLNANATSINRTHPPSCTYTVRCSSPRAALALSIVLRRYLFLLCWCRSCLLACILPCALTPPRPFDHHGGPAMTNRYFLIWQVYRLFARQNFFSVFKPLSCLRVPFVRARLFIPLARSLHVAARPLPSAPPSPPRDDAPIGRHHVADRLDPGIVF